MGVLYARVGGAWQPISASSPTAQDRWYSAWGVVVPRTSMSNAATSGTTSLTLQTVTGALVAGRQYVARVTGNAGYASTVQDAFQFSCTLDGAAIGNNVIAVDYINNYLSPFQYDFPFTATSGSHTIVLSVQRIGGTGTMQARMAVEVHDVGPVTGATLASAPTQDRWFSAWGVVASGTFVSGTSIALPNATLTQVTNTLPFTSTPGRKYRVTLTSRAMANGTTQSYFGVYLRDGTTPLNNQTLVNQPAVGFANLNCTWKFDGDGTTRSYNCSITPQGGASTLYADNVYDTAFYIEDMGPVTGAAIIPSVAVTAWTALPLQTGFADFGSGHQPSQYRLFGDTVQVRGLLRRSGADVPTLTSTAVATLPAGYWPVTTQTVPTVVATGSVLVGQIQVSTSGVISILMASTLVTGSNLALTSISFSTIT